MPFQPLTKAQVSLEHLGTCIQWSLPMGGTLTVGWGYSPHASTGQHVGTGRLWARLDVPTEPHAGVDLPFKGWFHWTTPRGVRGATEAVDAAGGFLGGMHILADYWKAAYLAERARVAELEDCVKRATAYLDAEAELDDAPAFPGGYLDDAYAEVGVEGDDDGLPLDYEPDEAGTSAPDWDPCGTW